MLRKEAPPPREREIGRTSTSGILSDTYSNSSGDCPPFYVSFVLGGCFLIQF